MHKKIAALLESLCDRPFGGEDRPLGGGADGHSLGMQDMARRAAPGLSHADAQQLGSGAEGAQAPGRSTAELASILSATATDAQCHAFQEAAMTSRAVRLDAQSALAFVDGIEQVPLAAPAHLLEQVVASAGGAPGYPKPGIWSRVSERWLVAPRSRMAAAFAVLLMGGGLSWSLLRGPADSPDDFVPVPAATSPKDAPLIISDPAKPEPAPPAMPAAAPTAAPMPAAALARAAPCEPRSIARPEALAEAATTLRSEIARSENAKRAVPKKQPKTAVAAAADPGCDPAVEPAGAEADKAAVAAGRNPQADQGPVRAARPASQLGGLDRNPPAAALSSPGSAPAAAPPALPAMRPSAIAPSR